MGNSAAEAQALAQGARQFFNAEADYHTLLCPSIDEHLAAAVHCFSRAIDLYVQLQEPSLAAALCTEAGQCLRSIDRAHLAMSFLQRAVQLQSKVCTTLNFCVGCCTAVEKCILSERSATRNTSRE